MPRPDPSNTTDAEMIGDIMRWPRYFLPIKKRDPDGGPFELAIVDPARTYNWKVRVYHVSLTQINPEAKTREEAITGHAFTDFASPEAVVAAGWVVD